MGRRGLARNQTQAGVRFDSNHQREPSEAPTSIVVGQVGPKLEASAMTHVRPRRGRPCLTEYKHRSRAQQEHCRHYGILEPPKFSGEPKEFDTWLRKLEYKLRNVKFQTHKDSIFYVHSFLGGAAEK